MDQYSLPERLFILKTYYATESNGGWDDVLRKKFGRKMPNEATVLQIDDENDEEAEEEEEECSESEQSASDDEEQSDETESDIPNKRKKSSSRIPKPRSKPTTTTIGIPKESSKSAFGHLVTVAEIRPDAPTAAPRQPIDCTTKNK